jgi:uncharacterized protein
VELAGSTLAAAANVLIVAHFLNIEIVGGLPGDVSPSNRRKLPSPPTPFGSTQPHVWSGSLRRIKVDGNNAKRLDPGTIVRPASRAMGDNIAAMNLPSISRRDFLHRTATLSASLALSGHGLFAGAAPASGAPLEVFDYGELTLNSELHKRQLDNTRAVLMGLNEDSLMKPFRAMSGLPATGDDLGGWYMYKPDYDYRKDSAGLCPGGTFGQWVSALARSYAITGDPSTRERVLRFNRLYAQSVAAGFFENNRFPAYCYDKLVCGLIDSHQFAQDPDAFATLQQTTDLALPHLPPRAVDREQSWRPGKEKDISYNWDESYTLPENLFLAYQRGAGERYKELAIRFLGDSTYFDPLAAGVNVLPAGTPTAMSTR